jgi:hypothetical protein
MINQLASLILPLAVKLVSEPCNAVLENTTSPSCPMVITDTGCPVPDLCPMKAPPFWTFSTITVRLLVPEVSFFSGQWTVSMRGVEHGLESWLRHDEGQAAVFPIIVMGFQSTTCARPSVTEYGYLYWTAVSSPIHSQCHVNRYGTY